MKEIKQSGSFKKDLKRIQRQGLNFQKLKLLLELLTQEKPIPHKNKLHKLSGEYSGLWECHIEPDWLLIFEITDTHILLRRTGSHSNLFR